MMESTDEMARPANVSGGAIMAAIVAALPIMFVGYGFGVLLYPFAVVVTSLHAALLGVPLYYLLRRWFDVGWTGSAINALGQGYELRAIASTVIGGANLMGGAGGAFGALVGSALLEVIRNALLMAGVDSNWQGFFVGSFLVLAVLLQRIRNASRE